MSRLVSVRFIYDLSVLVVSLQTPLIDASLIVTNVAFHERFCTLDDRCHRIGQTRDVHIYRLISERTVEENILRKANQKRLLSDVAIEGGKFTTAFFRQSIISDLFAEPSGLQVGAFHLICLIQHLWQSMKELAITNIVHPPSNV